GAAGNRPSTSVSRVSRLCPIFRAQPGACTRLERKSARCAAVRERCGNAKHRRRTLAGNFGQRAKPQAAKQEKAKVSCAHLGEHICPQCGQFGAFTQGLLRGQK
ncbi:MAG: hypothetical protein UD575_03620, partial [Oscillospiraceae bacterium]|nr:hypothetical protein [Oscillospiraceae bacterium]